MKNRGQTLIEVIIASAIIVIVLTAILGLATNIYTATSTSKSRLYAVSVAQNALEIVHNIRNTNWVKSSPNWDMSFYNGSDGYYSLNVFNPISGWGLNFASTNKISDGTINNIDGINFTRYIKVQKDNGSADKRIISIEVSWTENSKSQSIQITDKLTNWK